MAAESWGTGPPLEQLLFEEGYRFDFFQAVRLLERLYPDHQPVGRDANPSREVGRFHALLSLSFPPSAVHEIAPPKDGSGPAHMTVAFMGLIGASGVLPRHYTELVQERVRRKDSALRDFLDLFNHRLISLFYRAWEKHRFPIAYEQAITRGEWPDRFSQYLFDVIGLGTKGLRDRQAVADEVFLYYAGLLGQHPRSASALEGILRDYFGAPVAVQQFVGQWLPLPEASRSRLGPRGMNHALGTSAVAGGRVWDQQAKFTVRLGPLTFAEFCRFLPVGDAFRTLVEMIRFCAGQECDFDIQLLLRAAEVPACRLGETSASAPRLGWSTWLKSQAFGRDADDTILAGRLDHRTISYGAAAQEEEEAA
jgi:type VI secretion system protein ImpH